jgi:GGDEF domain-containing protein
MRQAPGRIGAGTRIARDIICRQVRQRPRQERVRAQCSHRHVAVMLIDLDQVKEVDAMLGHQSR